MNVQKSAPGARDCLRPLSRGSTPSPVIPFCRGLRVLVAGDSQQQLEQLRLSLRCIAEIASIDCASSVAQLRSQAARQVPDVAVVDVRFNGSDGFDLMRNFNRRYPSCDVIFLASSGDEAWKAFELDAVDFIVRPVTFGRLHDAISKAERRVWSREVRERFFELEERVSSLIPDCEVSRSPHQATLWVKNGSDLSQLPVCDVEWFEAAGDYVLAHAGERSHLLSETMNSLEGRLSPDEVIRVHRSSIVNIGRIRAVRKRRPRGLALVLESGKQVEIGGKYETAVLSLINAPHWR